MINITVVFPNEEEKEKFLGWLSDGGGEYEYMEYTDTKVNHFRYDKDTVTLEILEEEDEGE